MKRLVTCIAVIVLLTLLTSCVSNTVTKFVVPNLDFPTFPLADTIEDNGDNTSTVDNQWLVRLAEYSIRIQETEDDYNDIKRLYEKGEEQ